MQTCDHVLRSYLPYASFRTDPQKQNVEKSDKIMEKTDSWSSDDNEGDDGDDVDDDDEGDDTSLPSSTVTTPNTGRGN